jgi:hypothetical protein
MTTIVYKMGMESMDRLRCEKEKKPTPVRNNRRKAEISKIRGELWSLGKNIIKQAKTKNSG